MNNIDEFHQAAINVAHKHGYKPTEVIIYTRIDRMGTLRERVVSASVLQFGGEESTSFEKALESFEHKLKEYHAG